MLGRWQGTFCAGISTRNIERGVRGVDYVVNVRSFAQGRSDRGGGVGRCNTPPTSTSGKNQVKSQKVRKKNQVNLRSAYTSKQ